MGHETQHDDFSLVREAIAGRAEAFETLVLRHQDRLFGLLHRLVGDPERAMDLAQETFLKAWKGLASFQGESAFFTWLYRIARNVLSSMVRYDQARPRIRASVSSAMDDDHPRGDFEAFEASPAEVLLTAERKELVLAAVRSLPEEFREVIVLRDFQDLPYEEIAGLLEVPTGTVRSRLHRARLDLRERLKRVLDPTAETEEP